MLRTALFSFLAVLLFASVSCKTDPAAAGGKVQCKACKMEVPADKVCVKCGLCAMCDACTYACSTCGAQVKLANYCTKCKACKMCDKCAK